MFMRALVNGFEASPSNVTLSAPSSTRGTYSFNFTVDVTSGLHEARIQWTVDSGGTAYVGDRTAWVTTAPNLVNTVAVPSGPDVSTTNTTFADIPNLGLNIQVPQSGDMFFMLTAESDTTNDKRMFVRALVDGSVASPSDVLFAQEPAYGLHAFTFMASSLSAGIHPLQMQWAVDSGGTAYMADRTITIGFSDPTALAAGDGGVVSVSAPSGPDVSTTSTSFSNIPDMTTTIEVPENASLAAILTGEAESTSGHRMFVRALVDGQVAQPSDVVFNREFVGTRSFSFIQKHLAAGSHTVTMQWLTDSGGTAYMGDRNLSVIALPTVTHTATGWWYTQGEDGTGISIEIQGDALFMAWYTFDQSGKPIWHTSGATMTDSLHYSGPLIQWTG